MWYDYLVTLISESIQKFPKSHFLYILNAYIYFYKKENIFKALIEIQKMQQLKKQFQLDFFICRFKAACEKTLIERERNVEHKIQIDVKAALNFEQLIKKFQSSIKSATQFHIDFWNLLLQTDNLNLKYLQTSGIKTRRMVQSVKQIFADVHKINSNNVQAITMYAYFLLEVANEDDAEVRTHDPRLPRSSPAPRRSPLRSPAPPRSPLRPPPAAASWLTDPAR